MKTLPKISTTKDRLAHSEELREQIRRAERLVAEDRERQRIRSRPATTERASAGQSKIRFDLD